MKKAVMFFVLLFATLTLANAAPKKSSSATKPVITMARGLCYGECPAYELKIYSDGRVEYIGGKFVKKLGKAKGKISRADLKKLVDEFNRIGYFNLQDRYDRKVNPDGSIEEVPDLPMTVTSFTQGKKKKKVQNYYGAPRELTALQYKIDEVTNSARWVRRDPQ